MWKKFRLLRMYEPFLTGIVDMQIVAWLLVVIGLVFTDEDPGGVVAVCIGCVGLLMAIPMAGMYNCMIGEWVNECPIKETTLKTWKYAGESIVSGAPKKISWGDIQKYALGLKENHPAISYEFAHAAVIQAHLKQTSSRWLPPEATEFRWNNPKEFHIMGWV
ncbi:hypothetical protein pEaSNUABM9_00161 [Erwinia phage pEa_SNUABM_9]|nr:hypothetical protein pEaSNUABM9_00161 [Erwinia phage pEa_SNUABM_9]